MCGCNTADLLCSQTDEKEWFNDHCMKIKFNGKLASIKRLFMECLFFKSVKLA